MSDKNKNDLRIISEHTSNKSEFERILEDLVNDGFTIEQFSVAEECYHAVMIRKYEDVVDVIV